MTVFQLQSPFEPAGDQPRAIKQLVKGATAGRAHQVLLGVTGSGKTFTLAHVIAQLERPTLILAPNKTLAAQLYNEFRALFPDNAVEYFVSYYDYYQPEAYIPSSDTYIAKDSSINDMIDKLRHSATRSVLSRRDVIVVASVSCIFGLGAPEDYLAMRFELARGMPLDRDHLLRELISRQYTRNDIDFYRGTFRVRGDRVEIFPAYEEAQAIRVDFFGDDVDGISEIDPLRGTVFRQLDQVVLYPASHYVTRERTLTRARKSIMAELKQRLAQLYDNQRLVEAQRLEERTQFDLEMMQELGYCTGIENYSRHLTGRSTGEPPPTLLDYFPDDFLVCIDESHIAVPQLRAMFKGDRSRKQTLVEYGFRLPSALDNRPLRFEEFTARVAQTIYVSATPGDYEIGQSDGAVAEQIVRPTGLVDPELVVRPAQGQVDDLYAEIRRRIDRNERVLVTTLTKRMAEDLTDYFGSMGIRIRYLHADVNTLERMAIIHDLRLGEFDVLVGINLLREGLDLPEVSLVAILDADKEGFLRSTRSLIQTFGRAARNVNGLVLLYADTITGAMRAAMDETDRRRRIQVAYNRKNGIVPATIVKAIGQAFDWPHGQTASSGDSVSVAESAPTYDSTDALEEDIQSLEARMAEAVRDLAFETAAQLRDRIRELRRLRLAG